MATALPGLAALSWPPARAGTFRRVVIVVLGCAAIAVVSVTTLLLHRHRSRRAASATAGAGVSDGRAVVDVEAAAAERAGPPSDGRAAGDAVSERTAVQALESLAGAVTGLARRQQNLLARQRKALERVTGRVGGRDGGDELEGAVQLTDKLRRSTEALLVFVGERPTRRQRRLPTSLADVLAAAAPTGEARVVGMDLEPVWVAGRAVEDLVHLLAELIDDIAAAAQPSEPVALRATVHGRRLAIVLSADGRSRGPAELAAANELLGASAHAVPRWLPGRPRDLGLALVSHLAGRHDIVVRLESPLGPTGTSTGVVEAHVELPPGLVLTAPSRGDATGGATMVDRTDRGDRVGWAERADGGGGRSNARQQVAEERRRRLELFAAGRARARAAPTQHPPHGGGLEGDGQPGHLDDEHPGHLDDGHLDHADGHDQHDQDADRGVDRPALEDS